VCTGKFDHSDCESRIFDWVKCGNKERCRSSTNISNEHRKVQLVSVKVQCAINDNIINHSHGRKELISSTCDLDRKFDSRQNFTITFHT